MDKETLSNYGWIVICVLVLAVMIALATPFGNFIADGFKAAFLGFGQTNNSMLDTMFDATGTPPSLEYLQNKYQFEYYSTMNLAVTDVNNGTIGTSADSDKDDAVAGIYTDENGSINVVLLQDTTEATRVSPTVDMTLNLGGHTLTTSDSRALYITSGNIVIDGRLPGSTIKAAHADGTLVYTLQIIGDTNLTINGGVYTSHAEGTWSIVAFIGDTAKVSMSNATLRSTGTTSNTYTIYSATNTTTVLSRCDISADAPAGKSIGFLNTGIATLSNCIINTTNQEGITYGLSIQGDTATATISDSSIKAFANYNSDGNGNYSSLSIGIDCKKNTMLTVNNCNIKGVHSGVESIGTLYVNGGTYEGYGHGGLYFGGTGATSYVRNATIRECPMPTGYTDFGPGSNGSGFYIGGADNMTVYMDNCDIYGSRQPIVLRGTSNEQNNDLYISNSRINLDYTYTGVRIDNDTHKLYIGAGNNFTADNTGRPSAVITTNETYTQN